MRDLGIVRDDDWILLRTSGGAFVLSLLMPWVAAFSFMWLSGFSYSAYYIACMILPYLAMFLATMFVMSKRSRFGIFGLALPNTFSILFACLAQAAVYPMMLFLSSLCVFVYPDSTSGFETVDTNLVSMGPAWGYFTMALLPAVCEELLFRGLVYGAFRRQGFTIASMASILSFALMHGNIEQVTYTMLFGLLLAFVREFSGSVVPGMCAHFVLNSTGVTMMYFGDAFFGEPETDIAGSAISSWGGFWNENLPSLVVGMFGLALATLFVFLLKKSNKYRYNGRPQAITQDLPFSYAFGWGLCLVECWIG